MDIVGRLYRIDADSTKKYKLSNGDRVLSLVKWGGNSRYTSVDPARLVKIPDSVDPAEAACLVHTYLMAFQLLHHAQRNRLRYKKQALKGYTICVAGPLPSNLGRAIAQLSRAAGTLSVYCICKAKSTTQLAKIGIVPILDEPLEWLSRLEEQVDVLIMTGQEVTSLHYKLLSQRGQMIVVSQGSQDVGTKEKEDNSNNNSHRLICSRDKTLNKSRTSTYDVFREWETNTDLGKKDLEHLINLLQEGALSPVVLDRIPLSKVSKVHELLESKRLAGFLVCEPWLKSKSRAVRL